MKQTALLTKFWSYFIVLVLFFWYAIALSGNAVQASDSPVQQNGAILNLRAVQQSEGVWVEWQTAVTDDWTGFAVYHSPDCQWANASLVSAPMFSSVNSETSQVTYSLLHETTATPATCSYWVVGTDDAGTARTFGPIAVQARFGLYLPLMFQ